MTGYINEFNKNKNENKNKNKITMSLKVKNTIKYEKNRKINEYRF